MRLESILTLIDIDSKSNANCALFPRAVFLEQQEMINAISRVARCTVSVFTLVVPILLYIVTLFAKPSAPSLNRAAAAMEVP